MSGSNGETTRVLIAARSPVRVDDFELDAFDDIEVVRLVRRLGALIEVADEVDPHVLVIDASYVDGAAFDAISELAQLRPQVQALVLTADPPPHADVALAIRAGALGFVDVNAGREEYAAAIRAARSGEAYLPADATRAVFTDVAGDLDVTNAERRSRLLTIAIGFVPLTGAIAAILSLMWRKYLGHIGVRPVDLAIDPTTRVIDTVANLSLFLGVFGPMLYAASWYDYASGAISKLVGGRWLSEHRRLAIGIMSLCILTTTGLLAQFADLIVIVFLGPLVAFSLLAHTLDLQDELPWFLRTSELDPERVMIGGGGALFVFMTILSVEAWVLGPDLTTSGVDGVLAPQVLGFNAQPALVITVDGSREPEELLYLGGNADLYVFVDPCNDDAVSYVSVGSSRLEIIDVVDCAERE